jgi:hypothetical protein
MPTLNLADDWRTLLVMSDRLSSTSNAQAIAYSPARQTPALI